MECLEKKLGTSYDEIRGWLQSERISFSVDGEVNRSLRPFEYLLSVSYKMREAFERKFGQGIKPCSEGTNTITYWAHYSLRKGYSLDSLPDGIITVFNNTIIEQTIVRFVGRK